MANLCVGTFIKRKRKILSMSLSDDDDDDAVSYGEQLALKVHKTYKSCPY